MDNDRDLRNVILLLVKACNRSRRNLMAANMAIHAISNMSQDQRKTLSSGYIQAQLKNIEKQLEQQPDQAGLRIQKILEGEEPFLEALRVFASQLHW